MSDGRRRGWRARATAGLLVLACATGLGSCKSGPMARFLPGSTEEDATMTFAEIQAEVMDFSDELVARVSEGTSAMRRGTDDTAVWRLAHILKLTTAENAVSIAGGPNPVAALMDMAVMVTLMRQTLEARIPERFGERGQPVIEAFQLGEEKVWKIVERALKPEEARQLREAIASWSSENEEVTYVAAIRLNDFLAQRQGFTAEDKSGPTNILGFLYLDPLARLDPTTREIEQSRLLGERVVFLMPRLMKIARWHAEMLVYDLRATPTAEHVFANFDKVTAAVEKFGELAQQLPAMVAAERTAAIAELSGEATRQREEALQQVQRIVREERAATLADLEEAAGPIGSTLTELDRTIKDAEALAVELQKLAAATQDLTAQFKGDDDEPASSEPRDPNEPSGLEKFQGLVQEMTVAAQELTRLSDSLQGLAGRTAPGGEAEAGVRAALADVKEATDDVLDRLMWRTIAVVVVMGVVAFAAGVGVRKLGERRA